VYREGQQDCPSAQTANPAAIRCLLLERRWRARWPKAGLGSIEPLPGREVL